MDERERQRERLMGKEWTPEEWERLPEAPPLVPAMLWDVEMFTAKEVWEIMAEGITFEEVIDRFGRGTEIRLTRVAP